LVFGDLNRKPGSVAKIILLPFWAITIAFCIIIDLFMAHEFPICDSFHWFCKIARFFATEPDFVIGYNTCDYTPGLKSLDVEC